MAGVLRLNDALKLLGWIVAAMVLLAVGNRVADSLLFRPGGSVSARWIGVTIALGAWIPLLFMVGYSIRLGDEYQRHVFLIGIALAFAATFLLVIGVEVMRDAALIPYRARPPWLMLIVAMWGLGTAVSFAWHRLSG
jgi:hypothetical protein